MTITNGYWQSDNESHINVISLEDLREKAREIIPKNGYDYIANGSGNEWTLRRNGTAFDDVQIYPRVLTSIDSPDTTTEILGIKTSMPIMAACPAAQGLAHSQGEKDTAKGIAAAGTIMSESTYSTFTVEDICKAAPGAPNFFQIYASKDWNTNQAMLDMAQKAGCKAIVWTVDAAVVGHRESDQIDHFVYPMPMANLEALSSGGTGKSVGDLYSETMQSMSSDDVKRLTEMSQLPVIVKGVQHPDDAEAAMEGGASAIWVSNHGGRQLNGAPSSFEMLPGIADRVAKSVPLIFDSGIRSGEDVFKALASGADMVAIGRPLLYALACGGAQGVQDLMNAINEQLKTTMQLGGCKTVEDIKKTSLYTSPYR